MRSRSTLVDPNAFPTCPDALSLSACRSKCISHTLRCALARRPPIRVHAREVQTRSRSALVNPNASPLCLDALSLDERRPKRVSYVSGCALTRRLSIRMRFRYARIRARLSPASPNASSTCRNVLAQRPSVQMRSQYLKVCSRSTLLHLNAFPTHQNPCAQPASFHICTEVHRFRMKSCFISFGRIHLFWTSKQP